MNTKLLKKFETYYQNPSRHKDSLFEALMDFDDYNDFTNLSKECNQLKSSYCNTSCFDTRLSTNGSTGHSKSYTFSFFQYWRPKVENFLRGIKAHSVFLHDKPFLHYPKVDYQKITDKSLLINASNQWPQIIEKLKHHDPFVLITTPNCWLSITTNNHLSSELNKLPIIHGVNTDWEMFGKFESLKFAVKDQMIDWTTGINFYTCEANRKHFLPIFNLNDGLASNLLNLSQVNAIKYDDFFEIQGQTKCSCGKNRPLFNFQSHQKHYLNTNRNIISLLKDNYLNFQLIKSKDYLYVFRINKGDSTSVLEWLQSQGYNVKDMPNQYCRTGNKVYNFWKLGDSAYEFNNFSYPEDLNKRNVLMI